MFRNLRNEIIHLNADVKNVANCERAKKLKKKLLKIGLPCMIIGFLGVFTCFVLFAYLSITSFEEGVSSMTFILIPFFCIIPFGLLGSIGSVLTSLAVKIVITGYTTDLIDDVVRDQCPHCGKKLNGSENFCTECGTAIQKKCVKCGHLNDRNDHFCEQCGERID